MASVRVPEPAVARVGGGSVAPAPVRQQFGPAPRPHALAAARPAPRAAARRASRGSAGSAASARWTSSSSSPSCARGRHGVDLAHLRPRARGRARSRDPERVRRPGYVLESAVAGCEALTELIRRRSEPDLLADGADARRPTAGQASRCLQIPHARDETGADDVLQRRSRGDSRSPPMSRDHGGVTEMAEEVGFEPTVRLRARRFSRPVRSTAPPLLQTGSSVTRPSGAAKPGRRGARADPNGLGGAGSWPDDARRLSSAPAGRESDMRPTLA